MNKKGDALVGIPETILWTVVGIVIFLAMWNVGSYVFESAFSEEPIDKQSLNNFNHLASVVESKFEEPNGVENVPLQLAKDLIIVGFSKETIVIPGNCLGLEVIRPIKGCKGACLCICDLDKKQDMCNTKRAICKDFTGTDLNFNGVCNVAESYNEVRTVAVSKIDGKIEIKKV